MNNLEKSVIDKLLSVVEQESITRLSNRNVVTKSGGIPYEFIQREMTNGLLAILICKMADYNGDV